MSARRSAIVVGAIVGIGLVTTAVAGEMRLEVDDGLTLTVEEVSLRKVLVEIGATMPLTLIERGEAVDEPVSLTIEAETWPELLGELLGQKSYLLTFDSGRGEPARLVVLWDAVREVRAAASAEDPGNSVETRIRALAEDVLAPPDVVGEAIATMEDARGAWEAARGGPNEASAKAAFVSSVRSLADFDEPRTVDALLPTLDLYDRDARLATLETMRWLSSTGQNPDAVAAAGASFETADDPEIERAALEILVRYGEPTKVLRVLEPLALGDGPNRDFAVREWVRIKDELAARERITREGHPQLRALLRQR